MHHAKSLFIIILMQMLLIAISVSASDSVEPYSYEAFQPITPLDTTTQMLSSDTQVPTDVTVGTDYVLFGTVGKVSADGLRVHAEGANMYALVGVQGFQIGYARQEYDVTIHGPTGDTGFTHSADVVRVKWVPDNRIVRMPWNGQIALGGMMYFGQSSGADVDFTQPYAALAFEYGRARANIGVNWITGDLPEETGMFASLQYAVNPELVIYADYSEYDFHKLILNNVILPGAGIDCTACADDALSVGLAFKLGDVGYINAGAYDVDDLGSPMGSLSFRKQY